MESFIKFKNNNLVESISSIENELNKSSHELLQKYGYQPTGNKIKEKKFRQFSYKHPDHKTIVHTFINPKANSEQQIQHHVNGKFVHHTGLESALQGIK